MQDHALLERGTHGPVKTILKVESPSELHDVGEQVAVERRVI